MQSVAEAYEQPDNFKGLGYGLKVFGSYRLKTNSHDGDIDMLCIVPEYFSREKHFFVQLAGYLRKHEHIQEIFAIRIHLVN
jgi:poly(A) polymerase Pap1